MGDRAERHAAARLTKTPYYDANMGILPHCVLSNAVRRPAFYLRSTKWT